MLLNNLRSRVERWKRASLADSEAGRRREEAEKAIEDSSASLDRLFEGAGLEPGDERGLRDRLDRLDAYRERKAELKALEQQLKGLEARLAAEPELLGLDKDALEDLAGQARTAQERVDATRDEISEIEAEVRQARAAARREEALAEVAAARERLKEAFHLAMHRRAATLFLDRVEREHEQVARPDVLVRAQDWFKAFTHHRYELKVSGADPPAFRAFDNTAQRGLSLDELSDGTRVQLLLAARLAFATTAEPGESVPLFLDEPLTTSDPERFAAVAAALVALVGTGRQVFYLTSNPDDVARWHRACVRNGAEPPRVLDMEVIRGEAAEPPDPRALDLVVLPSVPAPAGMTPADYAEELRVPAPRPWDPVGALHLYFLLPDDLNLLFHVLSEAGVKTVGQWASFDRSGAATAVVSDAQNLALRARLRVCEATIHAARVGRGRPVDRRSLESSGAVSRSFIQKISALAEDLGGDAAALLEALSTRSDPRTKRFPRDKEVELKQWLEQREHLDERAPLHSSAAVARGLAAASEDVRGGRLTRSEVRRLAHTLFEALGTVDASAPRV